MALPEEFELIGSRVSPHHATVAFKTVLPPSQALARLAGTNFDAGLRRPSVVDDPDAKGFMFAQLQSIEESLTLCSDTQSGIGASAFTGHGGATYVTVVPFNSDPSSSPCSSEPRHSVARYEMPRLYMPTYGDGYPSGSSAMLKTTEPVDRIIGDFERQLIEQQWQRESRWADQRIVGSTWVSPDASTVGLLTVMSTDRGIYRLRFQASAIE
jgi:hypothetical protein